jgi:alkanesulfonate monooxygenase SsuD/methylene tetrahydromethanopterin reductase-like flavin-dependent oxidoreductase (luciferase family)
MRSLWGESSTTFDGQYYQVHEAKGTPRPVTKGGPPLVIGGGSKHILTLAGRFADTVGIMPSLSFGAFGAEVAAEAVVDKYVDRIAWAKAGAGDRADELEFQCWTAVVQVLPDEGASSNAANATKVHEGLASMFGLVPDQVRAMPLALIGTVGDIVETLQQRRESMGFSCIVVHEAEMEAFAPVVAQLVGI